MKKLVLFLVAIVVFSFSACGGGGGGGSTPPPQTPPAGNEPAPPPQTPPAGNEPAPDTGCTGSSSTTGEPCTSPSPVVLFKAPSDWSLNQVTTDGVSLFATGTNGEKAASVAFNSDGTIYWQDNTLPGQYQKSQVANGSLYAIRAYWSVGVGNTYHDRINTNTGSAVSVTTGTLSDPFGTTAFCGSLATSTNDIYVAAATSISQSEFSKFDEGLVNKTFLLTYSNSCVQDMDVSTEGNFFYSISRSSIDAYTMEGVYFGYVSAPSDAQFKNTRAKDDKLYVSGSQNGQAYVWVYGTDGSLQNSFSLGVGSAEGMTFGNDGEMYVAISGGVGPVRIDLTTGTAAWTGDTAGHSVAYLNGKIYLATGSNKIEVYSAEGGHLN